MSASVSTLSSATIGHFSYLFCLVYPDNFITAVAEELKKQRETFAEALGTKGNVISPFPSATTTVYNDVVSKNWNDKIKSKLRPLYTPEPFMLIINVSFNDFDPLIHPWCIIWFQKPQDIPRIFSNLARIVQNDSDILNYIDSLTPDADKHLGNQPETSAITIDVNQFFNFFN